MVNALSRKLVLAVYRPLPAEESVSGRFCFQRYEDKMGSIYFQNRNIILLFYGGRIESVHKAQ